MKRRHHALAALAVSGLGACVDADAGPEVTLTDSEITNGTAQTQALYLTYGLVAIYHRDFASLGGAWWPRPCSGKIMVSLGGQSTVLTARHCVTSNGEVDGPVLATSDMRLLATRQPGLAGASPPAGAVQPTSITALPIVEGERLSTQDLALIQVPADWSANVASRQGMFLGDPFVLETASVQTFAYGYGLNIDWPPPDGTDLCETVPVLTTGAGTARRGGPFTVSSSFTSVGRSYSYANNAGGQKIICGDSGGPDVTTFGAGSFHWGVLLGVHSEAGRFTATSTAMIDALYDAWGGVFLSPYSSPNTSLLAKTTPLFENTIPVASSLSASLFWYRPTTQQILVGNGSRCLAWAKRLDGFFAVMPSVCNLTALNQSWLVNADQQIVHVQTNKCLTFNASANTVGLGTCLVNDATAAGAAQRWAWHPQP